MRRIIERVVTVVTTTTWTISWQPDPQADPISDDFFGSDVPQEAAKHIQKISSVVTTKEADESKTEKAIDQTADEPPDNSDSEQSNKERK
jgi:hypothetical protein